MKFLILLVLSCLLTACSSTSTKPPLSKNQAKTSSPAYELFKEAQNLIERKLYEPALAALKDFRNTYPLHPLMVQVDLAVADIYYAQKNYTEAQYAYSFFKSLYPQNKKIDYVSYREAMSYFHQVPKVVERDLSLAVDSILVFRQLIQKHPNSEYSTSSKKYIEELLSRMAEKDFKVMRFYFKRKKYKVSLRRCQSFLKRHPHYRRIDEVLYFASVSALKLGYKKTSKKYYLKLLKKSQNKKLLKKANKELEHVISS